MALQLRDRRTGQLSKPVKRVHGSSERVVTYPSSPKPSSPKGVSFSDEAARSLAEKYPGQAFKTHEGDVYVGTRGKEVSGIDLTDPRNVEAIKSSHKEYKDVGSLFAAAKQPVAQTEETTNFIPSNATVEPGMSMSSQALRGVSSGFFDPFSTIKSWQRSPGYIPRPEESLGMVTTTVGVAGRVAAEYLGGRIVGSIAGLGVKFVSRGAGFGEYGAQIGKKFIGVTIKGLKESPSIERGARAALATNVALGGVAAGTTGYSLYQTRESGPEFGLTSVRLASGGAGFVKGYSSARPGVSITGIKPGQRTIFDAAYAGSKGSNIAYTGSQQSVAEWSLFGKPATGRVDTSISLVGTPRGVASNVRGASVTGIEVPFSRKGIFISESVAGVINPTRGFAFLKTATTNTAPGRTMLGVAEKPKVLAEGFGGRLEMFTTRGLVADSTQGTILGRTRGVNVATRTTFQQPRLSREEFVIGGEVVGSNILGVSVSRTPSTRLVGSGVSTRLGSGVKLITTSQSIAGRTSLSSRISSSGIKGRKASVMMSGRDNPSLNRLMTRQATKSATRSLSAVDYTPGVVGLRARGGFKGLLISQPRTRSGAEIVRGSLISGDVRGGSAATTRNLLRVSGLTMTRGVSVTKTGLLAGTTARQGLKLTGAQGITSAQGILSPPPTKISTPKSPPGFPAIGIPRLPLFGMSSSTTTGTNKKRKYTYNPSLTALFTGQKASKPIKIISGLEVRGVLS